MQAPPPAIKPLYERLKAFGLDRRYIHAAVLPDWWEDELSINDSNRLIAETSIARFLGIPLEQLLDPEREELSLVQDVRLKRNRDISVNSVTGCIVAASHAARITAKQLQDRLPFTGRKPALEIRDQLLSRPECMWPDLKNLVNFCWEHGIAVVHVTELPKTPKSKSIDGLATFVDERPVIVLTSKRKSPAWLAFHLAHEIGHIMCGHVKPGDGPLVDIKIDSAHDELQENEADRYAFQILTGSPTLNLTAPYPFRGIDLAEAAVEYGQEHRIHPGTVALIYGYSQQRLGVSQKALQALGEDTGAHEILSSAYRKYLDFDELPDTYRRSLSAMTNVFGHPQTLN